jgi:GT2 family glycosyltransferase/nucleoside-diphosphate-sugar epimerase
MRAWEHETDTADLVSVIIVNFNAGPLLTRCVESVLASAVPVEVFIADNNSKDGSLDEVRERFPVSRRFQIVENGRNLGFAKACNLGVQRTTGKYLLFLNPDCIIEPRGIGRIVEVMKANPDAGMAGCLLRNPDGSEQAGCRRYIPTPWRSLVRILNLSRIFKNDPDISSIDLAAQPLPGEPMPVEAISGAFMFVRRSALQKVGLLDDGYFMHCEDLDWCMRFHGAGYRILFVPDVEVVHAKGTCSASRPIRVEFYKHRGMVRFYRKFFWRRYPVVLMYLVVPAVWVRFLAKAIFLAIKRPARPDTSSLIPQAESLFLRPAGGQDTLALPEIVVTGATSQIGKFLLPKLCKSGFRVHALTRHAIGGRSVTGERITWHQSNVGGVSILPSLERPTALIHLAPLPTLLPLVESIAQQGIRRLIAFGSTSRFSKVHSRDAAEQELAKKLIEAEAALQKKCSEYGIVWTLFRPTLIYGCGQDRNVTTIARFVRRFGFFPLVGEGRGLRQPVHADDLAEACIQALECQATFNRAYNLSGGQTLTYFEMVREIFRCVKRSPRIFHTPPQLFHAVLKLVTFIPAYRNLNLEMAIRMNVDLCFDCSEATRDFGYRPRPFKLEEGTV